MVLRPLLRVLVARAASALAIGIPGGVLAYAAGSGGGFVGVVMGLMLVALAAFMILNSATARVRLEGGVLTSRTLFERHSVALANIARLVPVEITIEFSSWPNKLMNRWSSNRRRHFLDVRTEHGSTGIWLSPNVYGGDKVASLVGRLNLEPEVGVDHQTMLVSSTGRTQWPTSAVQATGGRLRPNSALFPALRALFGRTRQPRS